MLGLKAARLFIIDLFTNKEGNEFTEFIETIGAANAESIMKHFKETDAYKLITKAFKVISDRADELLACEDPSKVVTIARLQVWKDLINFHIDVIDHLSVDGLQNKMEENLKESQPTKNRLLL